MEIKRSIMVDLIEWKNKKDRKPLIIHGARQIGKTWVMKKFGEEQFKYVAYFNFDSDENLKSEFNNVKDAVKIINILRLYTDVPILPGETLIIFDEIQECGNALNSLKYFYENSPEYHVIAAGSLLGVALHREDGFPVGKVEFINMYPISFREFFKACESKTASIIDSFQSIDDFIEMPRIMISRLWERYRMYQISGGMPKVVVAALSDEGNKKIDQELKDLLSAFFYDFSKHAPTQEFPRIAQVWKSLPSQLAKENRKFIFKVIKTGARAREYESALTWLREAGLIYQIFCCSKPDLPLSAYDELNAFKIYLLDNGLLRRLAEMPAELYVTDSVHFKEFKGALAENLVLQQLLSLNFVMPRYWVSNGTAEVDFIIQNGLDIIPIEVKSGENISSKSLSVYVKKFKPKVSIIFSEKEFKVKREENICLHIPLPLISWTDKILSFI